MKIRQSDLKTWSRCPLQWRYENIDKLPREQSCALTFGTLIHEAILRMEEAYDVQVGLDFFVEYWTDPASLDPALAIDYYLRGRSWKKYHDQGIKLLQDWWGIIQWESDIVLAREYQFTVPVEGTDHELTGTVDKLALRYMPKQDRHGVLISDYKTNSRQPTYGYLAHDLQFSAYCYATTRPEFWTSIENGQSLHRDLADAPRLGEWVQLLGPARLSAGERTDMHYNRLKYAISAMADSVALRIFVPNISGDTCAYCDFRKTCGIPATKEQEAELLST